MKICGGETLNSVLSDLGLGHEKANTDSHQIRDADGCLLFEGNIPQIWAWLKSSGRIDRDPYARARALEALPIV